MNSGMDNTQDKLSTDNIKCPHCGELIAVSETLLNQLTEKAENTLREKIAKQNKALLKKEAELQKKEEEIISAQTNLEKEIGERIKLERVKLEKEAGEKAEDAFSTELKDLQRQVEEKTKKLQGAQEAELEIRKQKREIEEKKKALELEVARTLDSEKEKIIEETTKTVSEEYRLKDAEKDKKLQDAIKSNEELRHKLQQGSQQTQGEVLELELEEVLKTNFPHDQVDPVPKGVRGADVIQSVYNQSGLLCGMIVWESKNTKSWSNGWIQKLKEDQRECKADIAILITTALPKDIKAFGCKNGIWIASCNSIIGLATALRLSLIQVATTKLAARGKNEKMEVLYNYLSGPEFKHKVEAIVEAFVAMQQDLDEEKRIFAKRWAKREKQIQKVINNTAGMYGDLHGLMGSSMQSIPALESGEEVDHEG